MTSAVVPIRGMRRLRMTGTRTVGAGTTVEPPVGGRGVKPAAGEAAFVATAAAASARAAPTARGASGRGACCSRRPSPRPRLRPRPCGATHAAVAAARPSASRRRRAAAAACSSIAPGAGSSAGNARSRGGDRSRAGRRARPVAFGPVAVGARRGERRLVLGHRREHRQPGRRREGPRRRVGRHDREPPVVDDRLARQQPEVHPGGRDPRAVRDDERDLRRPEPRIRAAADVISSSTSR